MSSARLDEQAAPAQAASKGRLDGIEPALGSVLTTNQAVDDHVGHAGPSSGGDRGRTFCRQLDELPVDSGPGEPVFKQGAKERGRVRVRQDFQGKPDLITGSLGKLVDGPGDQRGVAGTTGWPQRRHKTSPTRA